MKTYRDFICLVTFLTLCSTSIIAKEDHARKTVLDSIMIDGTWRFFEYHVPQFPAENPRMIMVLHGDGMTTKNMQTVSDHKYNKLADKNGNTIVLYPQGDKKHWNDCSKVAFLETNKNGLSDVVFIKSIVQRMVRRYDIDRENIFAVGYFNGGEMCFKLAKSVPGLFKGFAIIGANLPQPANDGCTPSGKPVSLMLINETGNSLDPFDDGEYTVEPDLERGELLSTNETLRYWLELFGHTENISKHAPPLIIEKANSVAFRYDYCSKEQNRRISLLKIVKNGYSFTNPYFDRLPQSKANFDKYINIPETVVRFFYQLQYSNTMENSSRYDSIRTTGISIDQMLRY